MTHTSGLNFQFLFLLGARLGAGLGCQSWVRANYLAEAEWVKRVAVLVQCAAGQAVNVWHLVMAY